MFAKLIKRDAELFRRINAKVGHNPPLDMFAVVCSRWLLYPLFLVPFIAAWCLRETSIGSPSARAHEVALVTAGLRGLVAALVAFVGNWAFSRFAFRSRPFVTIRNERRLVPIPLTSQSFPSSHSSAGFALAFSVAVVDPALGAGLLAAAVLVAFGRVYTGVHYPLDVVAGVFVGCFWAFFFCCVGLQAQDFAVVHDALFASAKALR